MQNLKNSLVYFILLFLIVLGTTNILKTNFAHNQTLHQVLSASSKICQDIYAYYPAWRCCDEDKLSSGVYYDKETFIECSEENTRCVIHITKLYTGHPYYAKAYRAKQSNCVIKDWCWIGTCKAWQCDQEVEVSGPTIELKPGEVFYFRYRGTSSNPNVASADFFKYGKKLCDCPLNPCEVPCPKVPGSTMCTFVTNEAVYDESGKIKKSGELTEDGIAYTVPSGDCYSYYPEGNRHPIGSTCEQCESTSDCLTRYPDTYTWKGVTYGAVCSGGELQLYDCMATGPKVCMEWYDANKNNIKDPDEECIRWHKESRCDLFKVLKVECCPGTASCGPQAFCDPKTYTCNKTAECEEDYDCGRKITCDWITKKLKTPVCRNGKCDWEEEPVQCCLNTNCPEGWFCDSDYTCKEKPEIQQKCPYECCKNEKYYFDKSCPEGYICCADHTCKKKCESDPLTCNFNEICEPERGENKDNCRDCNTSPDTGCKLKYKKCVEKCKGLTSFSCEIKCWLDYQTCRVVEFGKKLLMWLGILTIVVLIIIMLVPILKSVITAPYRGYRGYYI